MKINPTVTIDNLSVAIEDEKNLLELIRKANIDLPTFCYHSEISVYGACRMCMVEVEGMGLVPACSTLPRDGMIVNTNTKRIRSMRKMIVELMLANHDQNCTSCPKSGDCKLQKIAHQMGISTIRFKNTQKHVPLDLSSDAIIRDPNKCVLCGDCVRVCKEIQSVGALDFADRGADAKVVPCFNKGLGEIECVNCGQCVKACPVGALMPKYQINEVWDVIHDPKKFVVVQIAPAVRVALGEYFGYQPGTTTIGQIVSALRLMGFSKVFDTSFGADLTVIEEGNEFLERFNKKTNLPQFTSCCPAWVKFAEQYYPDMLPNLSTCRSPQQMFGAICKEKLSEEMGLDRENIVVVSIMPCTAKKFEANREEFRVDGNKDVDFVLTTQELSLMIKERGIAFNKLEPDVFDMPFGFKTGAGVIFGTSGGVSEAVLRYAADKISNNQSGYSEFRQVRGEEGIRITEVIIEDVTLRLAVVSGLANARELIDKVRNGEEQFDLIEVMACCGGCVNGGGQPATDDKDAVKRRTKGLYDNDKMLQFHKSQENPYLNKLYDEFLSPHKCHELFHTEFKNRKRIEGEDILLSLHNEVVAEDNAPSGRLELKICFGTSCFLRGAQELYKSLVEYIKANNLESAIDFKASFCSEHCKKGPVLAVNGKVIEHCTIEMAIAEISANLK